MNDPGSFASYAATLEALIFASDKPIHERELQNYLPENYEVKDVLDSLMKRYDSTSGVELCRIGDSWAFRTRPSVAERLRHNKTEERQLSRAALEVLAIIAYHQPITRAEIEEIRGVSLSKGTMDTLLELAWIKPLGRRRTPGRPSTWGTTPAFLDHFGLEDVTDLPGLEELKASGLLRKGQVLGALMDHQNAGDDFDRSCDDTEDFSEALSEEGFLDNFCNGESDA